LNIKPGNRLEYTVDGQHATIQLLHGISALKGILYSSRGKGLSFSQVRALAAQAAYERGR
jgi:hypothetical protein